MKRVALLTIDDFGNYGNRLQNLAGQEVLRSLGVEVHTVRNAPEASEGVRANRMRSVARRLLTSSPRQVARLVSDKVTGAIEQRNHAELVEAKVSAGRQFSQQHVAYSPLAIQPDTGVPADLGEAYDAFVVGSDQVWNPLLRHGAATDFLTFANPEKRIAYAPSFGISSLPKAYRDSYREWLGAFAHLSVREHAGANIIRDLTGRDSHVLVDPTLMLEAEQWRTYARPHEAKPAGPTVVTYFLGSISPERSAAIDRLAAAAGARRVDLAKFSHPDVYGAGPAEFLDYLDSASLVVTDSFHGSVFSILFGTPFLVGSREGSAPSMSSRISTLLGTFGLQDRLWSEPTADPSVLDIDLSGAPSVLAREREKARAFLADALAVDGPQHESRILHTAEAR